MALVREEWRLLVAIGLLGLPVLLFRYLPMTDFPQHLAVASILTNLTDPGYQFDQFFEVDFSRTLYWLPYGMTLALAEVLPLSLALKVLVFASIVTYPIGVLVTLRSLGKPSAFALMTLPLVYNRAFFWGFINFNLAVGLAFITFGLLLRKERTRSTSIAIGVFTLAAALTHTHGLALIGIFGVVTLVQEPSRETFRRLLPIVVPGVIATALWTLMARAAPGYGAYDSPPALDRLRQFPNEVLGGYADSSDTIVLAGFLLVTAWLTFDRFPLTRPRLSRLPLPERVFWAMVVLNLVLYFVLPAHTKTAKFIHFRHAFLALSFLPLLCELPRGKGSVPRLLAPAVGLSAGLNSWAHLAAFDREARAFDEIAARVVGSAPTVAGMMFDSQGQVMRTFPYLHFIAYLQAERGGFITSSFAKFWNVPVKFKTDAQRPRTPPDFEWKPHLFDDRHFGGFYRWVVVRRNDGEVLEADVRFPFRLVHIASGWQLYERKQGS